MTFLAINFCIFMGFNMLLPTLSLYLDAQGCREFEIGLIYASFAVSSVTCRLLAARLSRRLGATRVVRRGLLVCFVGTFMFFVFPHPLFYALARLMHGAGFGMTSTLMVSMAAQVIPPRRMGEGLGYLGLGATMALAVGPLMGLWVSTSYGYKAMFVSIAFCYVAASLISLTLPPLRLASDSMEEPPGLRTFFERRAFPAASLVLFYGAAACAVSAYLALYCQEASLPSAAGFFVVSTVGTVAARLSSGRIFDRFGHRVVIIPAMLILCLALSAVVALPTPLYFYSAAVVYGLGAGAIFPSLQALTISSVPADRRTIAAAIYFIAFDLGIGMGTAAMGFLAGRMGTFSVVFLAAVCVIMAMGALYLYYYPRHGRQRPA